MNDEVVCVSLNGLNVLLEQQSASEKVKRQAGTTGNRHDLGYDMFWMFGIQNSSKDSK